MQTSITIIIPVFNLSGKRLRNFTFLLNNYLVKLGIKIFVVEQVKNNTTTQANILVRSLRNPNVAYMPVECDKNIFHKSYILNQSIKLVKTKYVWFIDADVFLRYNYILDAIEDQDVICPFENVFLLNEAQTQKFIDTKQFIVAAGKKFQTINKFGPLSIVIKTDIFKTVLMDEKYTGWGWEDLDFAYRITQRYSITRLDVNGLHLWHDVSKSNPEQEKVNRRIFFKAREQLTFKGVKTSIPAQLSGFNFPSIVNPPQTFQLPFRIVHVFSPALLPHKKELYNRELMAIESIIKDQTPNVIKIMICDSPESKKYEKDFRVIALSRSSKDIGDKRGLPYIPDMFKEACNYCFDDDIIFYTNSDCCIAPGIYNRLANNKGAAIEYHRRDVSASTLEEVFTNPSVVKETGVDGLAFRKKFFTDNSYLIPDFFAGEPHWDTAICGALRTKGVSVQNTIDLYHPIHEQAWDPKNLNVAGKVNDKIYRDFLEYGISNIRLLSKPEEKIETSVVLVHYGTDEKRVNAAKRAMSKLPYQNILNAEFIFVDVIKDATLFPEVDVKPNWIHIVLKEKETNKDIFQKEAMMNIGSKLAKGKVVIFLDTDVWSHDSNWLNAISKKIQENPLKIVHGFSFCQDSKNSDHTFISIGLNTCKNIESSLHENPGLVFGISKEILVKNDYLNVYSIMGGGDSMTMHEYLSKNYSHCTAWWQASFPRLKNTLRDLPICGICDYVDVSIIHENHGDVDFGYYGARHHATKYFTKEIPELLVFGDNGLLEWADANCIERQIIKAKILMKTEKDTRRACEGIISNHKKEQS